MSQSGECVIEEEFWRIPFGFGEEVTDGLSGASTAEEFCHFGETFFSVERGEGEGDSPEVRKVTATNQFSGAFEISLAKGRESVYSEHWTFRLWVPGNGRFFLQTNHSEMSAFYARAVPKRRGLLQFELH